MTQDYKDTLSLPKTDFPMRAGLAQKEPALLARWEKNRLYQAMLEKNRGRPIYTLHDGPPYANGNTHHGHVLNKVLKDLVVRSRNMMGYCAEFVPGWDCHGLPIEIQIDRELGARKKQLDQVAVRRLCRAHAEKWVAIQSREFQRLGCIGRWEEPYLTMNYSYEAQIARELAAFVEKGLVFRGRKPVYWCTHCNGALAEFEVEYADHQSDSIYVKFPAAPDLLAKLPESVRGRPVQVVIWTTTPWTLPANLAIALNPALAYVIVEAKGELLLMARDLVAATAMACNLGQPAVVAEVAPRALERTNARHPFLDRQSLIILAGHVNLEAGTGCVHTAPGHGLEDYVVGLEYSLDILTPVDGQGRFTSEAGPDWVGQDVWQANAPIVQMLHDRGFLLNQPGEKITHSYPHCWRHKAPLLFRATDQWFISMAAGELRQRALAGIKQTRWLPEWGEERITGMVQNRPDWCISRQRSWGVPIIALHCRACGEPIIDAKIIRHVADNFFAREGADAWYAHPVGEMLPASLACPKCGGQEFEKELDILDVWFDSGVSYAADVGLRAPERIPVDLYLEGSDQHRGWFQSSLLCGVGTRGQPPYKMVITHGFVVDQEGKAYSKSRIEEAKRLGKKINYVPPEKVIKEQGAELLRLWVAAADYRNEITFSEEILERLGEAYRKIRNTIRFLLGNLGDFDPARHAVPVAQMRELDRWALGKFHAFAGRLIEAYREYEYHTVFHLAVEFCSVTLSAAYFDILKDRLYTSGAEAQERRSAQTALRLIAGGLLKLLAPILSFTADEAWMHWRRAGEPESVHLADFPALDPEWWDEPLMERWRELFAIRDVVLKALEEARKGKVLGQSLEALVTLDAAGRAFTLLERYQAGLPELFIVSRVELKEAPAEQVAETGAGLKVAVRVERCPGVKCPRCWNITEHPGVNTAHPELCPRCTRALAG